jgi:DNA-binding transcriptional LysR family regulator
MAGVNLKNVDLNLLVVFEAIYSTGNISTAATQLAMSQPAVSNALARLRDLIGDPLFVRGRRGVESTSKAHEMIGPVREALALIRRQLDGGGSVDPATLRRRFRILMIDTLEPLLSPPLIKSIVEKAPGVSIETISGYRVDFVNEILTGTLDLAFYIFPVDAADIVTVPICAVDAVFIARRNHPGIGKRLDVDTFSSLRHIALVPELRVQTHIDKDLAAHQVPRNIVYMVNRLWSFPPLIERTDLIGAVPRRFAEEVSRNFDIVIHEPPIEMSEQYLYMIWHAKNENEPGHRWLREQMLLTARAVFPQRGLPSVAGSKAAAKRAAVQQPQPSAAQGSRVTSRADSGGPVHRGHRPARSRRSVPRP